MNFQLLVAGSQQHSIIFLSNSLRSFVYCKMKNYILHHKMGLHLCNYMYQYNIKYLEMYTNRNSVFIVGQYWSRVWFKTSVIKADNSISLALKTARKQTSWIWTSQTNLRWMDIPDSFSPVIFQREISFGNRKWPPYITVSPQIPPSQNSFLQKWSTKWNGRLTFSGQDYLPWNSVKWLQLQESSSVIYFFSLFLAA